MLTRKWMVLAATLALAGHLLEGAHAQQAPEQESKWTPLQAHEQFEKLKTHRTDLRLQMYFTVNKILNAHRQLAIALDKDGLVRAIDRTEKAYTGRVLQSYDVKILCGRIEKVNARLLEAMRARVVSNAVQNQQLALALSSYEQAAMQADLFTQQAHRFGHDVSDAMLLAPKMQREMLNHEFRLVGQSVQALVQMNMHMTTTGLEMVKCCRALNVDVAQVSKQFKQTSAYLMNPTLWIELE